MQTIPFGGSPKLYFIIHNYLKTVHWGGEGGGAFIYNFIFNPEESHKSCSLVHTQILILNSLLFCLFVLFTALTLV